MLNQELNQELNQIPLTHTSLCDFFKLEIDFLLEFVFYVPEYIKYDPKKCGILYHLKIKNNDIHERMVYANGHDFDLLFRVPIKKGLPNMNSLLVKLYPYSITQDHNGQNQLTGKVRIKNVQYEYKVIPITITNNLGI